jgi:hypothetical protein
MLAGLFRNFADVALICPLRTVGSYTSARIRRKGRAPRARLFPRQLLREKHDSAAIAAVHAAFDLGWAWL